MRYSPSIKCFFPTDIAYAVEYLPADLVDVPYTEYQMVQNRAIDEGYDYVDGHLVILPPPQPTLAEHAAGALLRIDHHAEVTRVAAVGDVLRSVEYDLVAAEADVFKASGYQGDAPPTIKSWMDVTGMSAQEACDNILTTRANYISCLTQVRDIRLKGKAAVSTATDVASVDAAVEDALAKLKVIYDYVITL